jgi:two-component system phosphate regulon response regulator OmpR
VSDAPEDLSPHVLIVDDDRRIRQLLSAYLAANGFRTTAAASAEAASAVMRGLAFDAIVLDIMMPGRSGLDLAAEMRGGNNAVPILFLSALAETEDRITGLSSGGDDYLTKPFEPLELLLRLRSILRRSATPASSPSEVRFGACNFSPARGELRRGDKIVRLTTRERDMLRLFVQRPGQTLSRGMLQQGEREEGARAVDVHINRLRRKIEDDPANPVYLQTVRGAGYTLHLD